MIFHHPPYTLPLTNAMPSLPPSVTDDDNITSSTLSELDSDQFTQSTEDDVSSDSQLNT